MSNSVESLEDEQWQKLDCEAIRDFREVSREVLLVLLCAYKYHKWPFNILSFHIISSTTFKEKCQGVRAEDLYRVS